MDERKDNVVNIGDFKNRRAQAKHDAPEKAASEPLTPEVRERLENVRKNLEEFIETIKQKYVFFYENRRKWVDANLEKNPEKQNIIKEIDENWDKELHTLKESIDMFLKNRDQLWNLYGSLPPSVGKFIAKSNLCASIFARLADEMEKARDKFSIEIIMKKADNDLRSIDFDSRDF
jgi:hypothetical protein